MANPSRIEGDMHVAGTISANTLIPSDAAVGDTQVKSPTLPADAVSAAKLEHQHSFTYSQESATSAADGAYVIGTIYGTAASVVHIEAASVVANIGAAVVDVDLLKNGASILTAVIQLDSTDVAYIPKAGVISSSALVDNDVLEVSINGTAGGGTLAKGVFVTVTIREDPV